LDDFVRLEKLGQLTQEHLLLPVNCDVPYKQYLADLAMADGAMVQILSSALAGAHGLKGKKGNRMKIRLRELFKKFIVEHRSPTARTVQSDGRMHGSA